VLCAGTHFEAGRKLLRQVLSDHGLLYVDSAENTDSIDDGATDHRSRPLVEIVHAPTDDDVMDLAPTVHVAIPFMQRFSTDFIAKATQLRLIQQFGVGLEGVAVDTATEHGVAVSNIPADGSGNAAATAEHAIFLTLSLLRNARFGLPKLLEQGILGGWPMPRALYDKRVTLVGYGSLGSTLANILYHMTQHLTVIRQRPWQPDDAVHLPKIERLQSHDIEDVLPCTDVLILACVLTPETRYMVNERLLSQLPKHAIVINVGRGPLVEYEAIKKALETHALAGFASDVGLVTPSLGRPAGEPWDVHDPLHNHPNVYFTPHVGGYTDYSYGLMVQRVVQSIVDVLECRPPEVFVNQ
jgi:phosphoglycerate dehydrogenase-like enzyme